MVAVIRCLRSDLLKLHHTPVIWMHVALPLACAGLFLGYYAVSAWNPLSELSGFLEVIGILLPLAAGIVCGMVSDQEAHAGSFQHMLAGLPSRLATGTGKLLALSALGAAAIAIVIGVFGIGFGQAPVSLYLTAFAALAFGYTVLCILHLAVGSRFGRGATIGLGIVESLVAALAATGLGDGIWYFIPCAWPARLCDMVVALWAAPDLSAQVAADMHLFVIIGATITVALILCAGIWFRLWDGRRSHE